ncbi:hypothetical protein HZH66_010645 [Vespula vulgaris]|uniref:Uncharacterized protein n=1 Tax=Vespula vulgaris TaxID=7454 RepID=A0A834JGG9_VESVU|nr:hypothetical protein HZH66_010645 [Vespula vulgaris]
MSIVPLWPSLRPRITDPLWFDADSPVDEESEVTALEAEHQAWREHVRVQGYDHIPIGKTVSDVKEEEELDEIDMEVSYPHQPQRSSPTDTVTDPVSIRVVNSVNAHTPRYT